MGAEQPPEIGRRLVEIALDSVVASLDEQTLVFGQASRKLSRSPALLPRLGFISQRRPCLRELRTDHRIVGREGRRAVQQISRRHGFSVSQFFSALLV